MAETTATSEETTEIRRLACDSKMVRTIKSVEFDLMGYGLTKSDICEEIVAWIDAGESVKATTLHSFPGMLGQRAFELKPRINDRLFYIKMTFQKLQDTDQLLLILSSHPNH